MFSSILDTVRLADEKQLTLVEAFLMRAALSGNPAILSPNQAIDSAAIQAITDGNGQNSKNHFLRAVELGIVRVSLPADTRTILDHAMNTINRTLVTPDNGFIFSSLKFLYEEEDGRCVYAPAARSAVLEYISNELSHARQRGHHAAPLPVTLLPEEQEMIHRYIRVISELDLAIRSYDRYAYLKQLYPELVRTALSDRLRTTQPDTALAGLILQMLKGCDVPEASMYRSFYYRLCDQYAHQFGAEAVREVREILDICYNKLIAISLHEQAEINISPDLPQTADAQAAGEDVAESLMTTWHQTTDYTQKLDWEMLVEIYLEIGSLMEAKHLLWQEALELYHARQSALPFMLGGKYAVITSLTMALSAVPVVGTLVGNAVAEILVNALFGELEGVLGKPSVKEIVERSKKASKQVQMMDLIICTDPQKIAGRG